MRARKAPTHCTFSLALQQVFFNENFMLLNHCEIQGYSRSGFCQTMLKPPPLLQCTLFWVCGPVSVRWSKKLTSCHAGARLWAWFPHLLCGVAVMRAGHTPSRELEGLILRLALQLSQLLASGCNLLPNVQLTCGVGSWMEGSLSRYGSSPQSSFWLQGGSEGGLRIVTFTCQCNRKRYTLLF